MIQELEKLYDLITECRVRRLTTQESLDYIKSNGIELSERTYRRYKKELEDKVNERILEEGERVHESEFLHRLDLTRQIEKELWILYYNTKNEPLKEKILQSIRDTLETSKKCYSDVRWRSLKIRDEIEKSKDPKSEYDKVKEQEEQRGDEEYWRGKIEEDFPDYKKDKILKSRNKLDSLTN